MNYPRIRLISLGYVLAFAIRIVGANFSFAKICNFFKKSAEFQLENFVDVEKCCKMRIWMQNFVSIQTRTSLKKSDVSWPIDGRLDEREELGKAAQQAHHAREAQQPERCLGFPSTDCPSLFPSIGHDTSFFFWLVLVCIETKFRIQIRILQHFSKSTKLFS